LLRSKYAAKEACRVIIGCFGNGCSTGGFVVKGVGMLVLAGKGGCNLHALEEGIVEVAAGGKT
jgi:hypothetical protein